MIINQTTRLNIIIGHPLAHTKSPLLHTTLYQILGINAVLLAFPHNNLAVLMQAIKTLAIPLTLVTMPYKEQVLDHLDSAAPEVHALKAVNTLIQRDGKLHGYNTDIFGIEYALANTELEQKNILILGAGGAARALGYVLHHKNSNLFWLNRTKSKSTILANEFSGSVITPANLADLNIDIIINTTSIGMYPDIEAVPLNNYKFNATQTVFDMVYNPELTLLLQQAKLANASIISGVEMFIGQALRQIELWQELSQSLASDTRININNLKNLLTGNHL